jgi:matrixin/BACON domain-containing protein/all-beta uncharacterized protein
MNKTRSLLLSFVCCALLAQPVAASTVLYRSDAQLIAMSQRVVHARVISQRTTWDGPQRQMIYTVSTLEILEDFTGQPGDTIEVWELGGRLDGVIKYVGGAVKYAIGDEAVVCLERGPLGYRSVSMNLSKFDVVSTTDGPQLRRKMEDTFVVGGAVADAPRSLESFRQLAVSVTGRSSLRYQRPQSVPPNPTEAPFTKLNDLEPGFRWANADQGTPLLYYRNTSAASPLLSGDSTPEIQTALAAWTNPASASITVQFGGTTLQSVAKGPWPGLTGPSGVITYEDPNNEIPSNVLAIGGGDASDVQGSGGTVNGTAYYGFTRGYVIFNNVAELTSDFRQSINFTRVLTHEIGHTLGLGHTQDDGSIPNPKSNIMYFSCCHAETPVPPALGLDDVAGIAFIYPVGRTNGCTYSLNTQTATAGAGGGAGSVILNTQAGCSWAATSNSSFITLASASSGTGSATIQYSVASNASLTSRLGSISVTGLTLSVTQAAAVGASMALDKNTLFYGATLSGSTVTAQTSAQVVRMTQTSAGSVSWTATPTQPWIQVSPSSGSGSTNFTITVSPTGLPIGTFTGAINIALTGTTNTVGPISVSLNTIVHGLSTAPLGVVDTPLPNASGITGAVPFTGWAVDDIEVTRTTLCRAAFGAEVAPIDPNCGGLAQIYVGQAVFVDGARPDVQAAYAGKPRDTRAGWGFMVLTNMLPAQGNGTYVFYAHAYDREGHSFLMGTRSISIDNAHATKPFGFIDTPEQGGVISGTSYVNFGWALTQASKIIPTDGSTMFVLIDGASIGNVNYNNFRPDIANAFPGLQNSNGAVGHRTFDTTALANGVHTISWTVTDSGGAIEGIGSRYFTVSNGVAGLTAASVEASALASTANESGNAAARASAVAAAPVDTAPILGRRGWDLNAAWRAYPIGSAGRAVMRGEEVDRFELWFGEQRGVTYRGYLRVGDSLAPLPAGSQLDATNGWFTWAPGVGFVGTYDLVFVRWNGARAIGRQDVRIILAPKGSGYVGVQVEIDTPRNESSVGQPFLLGGWAADLYAAAGTGIDALHVWAYPLAGGPPVFLGATSYGGARPDVASIHGDQFRNSGFGVLVQGLPSGTYDLAVFPWSNVSNGFAPAKTVRVVIP